MSCEKVSIFFPNLFEAGMSDKVNRIYRFKSFLLNVGERQLFDGDTEISLTPKTFDVLVHLVENAGHLVRKDELMRAVWPDSFVEEVNIPRSVHHLRKTLGQDNNGSRFIETIPTKGYRFTMPVVEAETTTPATGPESDRASSTRSLAGSAELPGEAYIDTDTQVSIERPWNLGLLRRPILVGGFVSVLLVLGAFWFGSGTAYNVGMNGQTPPTRNSGAYRLYLEGKFILDRRHENHGEEALAKFEEAIKLDPDFALAYAGKADAEWRVFHTPQRAHDDIARTRASINKALSLDPNSSYAHTILCRMYTTYDWDFASAERACRRAVELDPNSHDARHELSMFLTQFARHSEAIAEVDAAVALAPTSFNKRQRALTLFYAKRYREAIDQFEEVRRSDPKFPEGLHWLWQFYAMDGNYDMALETYLDWQKDLGLTEAENDLRPIYSVEGWTGVQKAIVKKYKPGDRSGVTVAGLHCQLGDKDKTIEFLESELKRRTLWMIHLIADPRFDPCRDDPRFDAILQRVGLK